ncbi:hypothetical protein LK429_03740 [Hoylesella buccalis]|uniref:hypothetical protein n=1 Tax=Hoylesella buccalis TaxID=28127 RepID=UPI001D13C6E6|nr:hypothetical protein [Hoylesella buccalis]UEA63692.1 hypothetical protein LK429_03740 [Hoylesella buccalis]UWP49016.1 hypothetical protein NQ518_10890 [Hoylesella buccalis ATCC 35310]
MIFKTVKVRRFIGCLFYLRSLQKPFFCHFSGQKEGNLIIPGRATCKAYPYEAAWNAGPACHAKAMPHPQKGCGNYGCEEFDLAS